MNKILLIALMLLASNSEAATYTFTNCDDTGSGSFRKAIGNANLNAGKDIVTFGTPFVCNAQQAIILESEIDIDDDITINLATLPTGMTQFSVVHSMDATVGWDDNTEAMFNMVEGADISILGPGPDPLLGGSFDLIFRGGRIPIAFQPLHYRGRFITSDGGDILLDGLHALDFITCGPNNSAGNTDCTSGEPGGIIKMDGGVLEIKSSRIEGGVATEGGAVYAVNNLSVEITDSGIMWSYAEGDGGGVYQDEGLALIKRTQFLENFANASTTSVGGTQYYHNDPDVDSIMDNSQFLIRVDPCYPFGNCVSCKAQLYVDGTGEWTILQSLFHNDAPALYPNTDCTLAEGVATDSGIGLVIKNSIFGRAPSCDIGGTVAATDTWENDVNEPCGGTDDGTGAKDFHSSHCWRKIEDDHVFRAGWAPGERIGTGPLPLLCDFTATCSDYENEATKITGAHKDMALKIRGALTEPGSIEERCEE